MRVGRVRETESLGSLLICPGKVGLGIGRGLNGGRGPKVLVGGIGGEPLVGAKVGSAVASEISSDIGEGVSVRM